MRKNQSYLMGAASVLSMLMLTACDNGSSTVIAPEAVIDNAAVAPFMENGGSTTFSVVLDQKPGIDVLLDVVSNDLSEAETDTASLVFTSANWDVPQVVTVNGIDDFQADGNQTFDIVVSPDVASGEKYASLITQNVSVTTQDDDSAGITIDQGAIVPFSENAGTITYTVVLNTEPLNDVIIDMVSNDATEAALSTSSLTFTATDWSVPQTVSLNGVDDFVADGNQSFDLVVSPNAASSTEYALLLAQNIAITVQDDDSDGITIDQSALNSFSENAGASTFAVVLNTTPVNDVTINVVSNDTTEATVVQASLTFTSADWNVAQTVNLAGVNDSVDDGNQTFNVVVSPDISSSAEYASLLAQNVSVIVTDDDTAGFGGQIDPRTTFTEAEARSITVRLNTQPMSNVVVDMASNNVSRATVDKASLTFTPVDWATEQRVLVIGVNNNIADGSQVIQVTQSVNPSSSSEYLSVLGRAYSYTVLDNDAAGIAIDTTITAPVSEAGTTTTFAVALSSQPVGVVVIDVASNDTTEVVVDKASLTFTSADWSTPQIVTASGVNDFLADGNQVVGVALAVSNLTTDTTGYAALTIPAVPITNSDDDVAGFTFMSWTGAPFPLFTKEATLFDRFTVRPNTQVSPGQTVSITIVSSDLTEGTVTPATLSWSENDWQTAKEVRVLPVDDAIPDGSVTYNVEIDSTTSTEVAYQSLPVQTVSVTNADNDPGLVVTAVSENTSEAFKATASYFDISLSTQPGVDVIIPFVSSDPTEGLAIPLGGTLTFTLANWSVPQRVTVVGVNDDVNDGDVAYSINIGPTSSTSAAYNALTPPSVQLTNVDDDAVFTLANGQMVENDGPGKSMTWGETVNYCNGLNKMGLTWHMPNVTELNLVAAEKGSLSSVLDGLYHASDDATTLGRPAGSRCYRRITPVFNTTWCYGDTTNPGLALCMTP